MLAGGLLCGITAGLLRDFATQLFCAGGFRRVVAVSGALPAQQSDGWQVRQQWGIRNRVRGVAQCLRRRSAFYYLLKFIQDKDIVNHG